MAERATKKKLREPIVPWGDIALDALPEGEPRARVELAMRAFDRGDYVLVRALVRELAGSSDEKVRAAAERLAARIAVDRVQVMIIAGCALFLVAVALEFVFRS